MRVKAVAVLALCASLVFCASSQKKMLKAREKDPKYQYNLGLFHLNRNNSDEALKCFVKALALDARFYEAWNMIGLAHASKGHLEEAVKAYQKSLEINPQFTEVHNNLGTVYQEMGQLGKAETAYKAALSDPTYLNRESPSYNLARLYLLQNRLDEALENVQKSIQFKLRFAMAHDLRGVIQEKLGNLPEAIASYEAAVKIEPEEIPFSYRLAVAYFKAENYAKAKAIFLKISARVTDVESKDAIANYLKLIRDKGGLGPV